MEIERDDSVEIEGLPVFPLSTAVLFPGIVLSLHAHRPCDRALIADALAGDRVLAVAMIRPEAKGDVQVLCDVAGAGRIIHADELPEGTYDVLVQGLDRVRLLDELPAELAYRRFRAEIIPKPGPRETEAAKTEILHLESCVLKLVALVADTDAQLAEVARATPDIVQLADFLSATVVQDMSTQQELLAAVDLRLRLAKLIDILAEVLGRAQAPGPSRRTLN